MEIRMPPRNIACWWRRDAGVGAREWMFGAACTPLKALMAREYASSIPVNAKLGILAWPSVDKRLAVWEIWKYSALG
jgi:hypothetical protein